MSQRAKFKYMLIFFSLLIWAIIFYKINTVISKKNKPNNYEKIYNTPSIRNIIDTIKLSLNYPDPFLVATVTPEYKSVKKAIVFQKTSQAKNLKTEWPRIECLSIIINRSKNNYIVNVKIDNNHITFYEKSDIYNGVSLKEVYQDSILISFNNETKSIKIK